MANEALKIANMEKANAVLLENMMKRGITATTKELIAREAGLSLASIVRYYPSKDDMVLAALAQISKGQEERCNHFAGTGAERLCQFFDSVMDYFFEEPEMYGLRMEIVSYAHYAETDALAKLFDVIGLRKAFVEILKLGVADGTLKLDLEVEVAGNYYPDILFGYMSDLAMRHDVRKAGSREMARANIGHLMEDMKTLLIAK